MNQSAPSLRTMPGCCSRSRSRSQRPAAAADSGWRAANRCRRSWRSRTDFAREFERHLKDSGARIQVQDADASATVMVTRDEVRRRVLSVSASNIPTEYELTYTVTIAVRSAGKEVLAPQTLSLSRDYSFDENTLLAKENEEDVLRVQMARDLAVIATRRLASLK